MAKITLDLTKNQEKALTKALEIYLDSLYDDRVDADDEEELEKVERDIDSLHALLYQLTNKLVKIA